MTDLEIITALRDLQAGVQHPETSENAFQIALATLTNASRDSDRRRETCTPNALQLCCSVLRYGSTQPEPFPMYAENAVIFLNNSCPDDESVRDIAANKRTILQCGGVITLIGLLDSRDPSIWEKVLSALNNICLEYEAAQRALADSERHALQAIVHLALIHRHSLEIQHDQQDDLCALAEMVGDNWASSSIFHTDDYMMLCKAASQVNWQAQNFCIFARVCLKMLPVSQILSQNPQVFDSFFSVVQASFQYFNGNLGDSGVYSESSDHDHDATSLLRNDCRGTQNDLLEKLYETGKTGVAIPRSFMSRYTQFFQEESSQPAKICACYVFCGFVLQNDMELLDELSNGSFMGMITETLSKEENVQGIRAQLQLIGLLALSGAPNARVNCVRVGTIETLSRFFQGHTKNFLNPQLDATITARKLLIDSVPLVLQFFGIEEREFNYECNRPQHNSGYHMLELWNRTNNTDLKAEIARVVAQVCRSLKRTPQCTAVLNAVFTSVGNEQNIIEPLLFTTTHHPSEGIRIESWMAMGVLTEVASGRKALLGAVNHNMAFRDKIRMTSQLESGYERENLKVILAHMLDEVLEATEWLDDAARNLRLELDNSQKISLGGVFHNT